MSMSTVGSYAQASTGNPAMDRILELNKALFATVATGVVASATAGLKVKEIYDENKDAVYNNALKAYDSMSENAKQSWASAVARGRTGADLATDFWEFLTSAISDTFKSKSGNVTGNMALNFDIASDYSRQETDYYNHTYQVGAYVIKTPTRVSFDYSYKTSTGNVYNSSFDNYLNLSFYTKYEIGTSWNASNLTVSSFINKDIPVSKLAQLDSDIRTVRDLQTLANFLLKYGSYTSFSINGITGTVQENIYDQTLKRALETDIPRMKDAGLVIPQVDVRTPSGTRVNYDAQAGSVTLPDGSIYDGDLVVGNVPDAVIKDNTTVWHDTKTNTDTDIWDGTITDTATGTIIDNIKDKAGTAEGEAGGIDSTDLPAGTETIPVRGIDWTPLVTSATNLTERFPFSIPWDLQRMISIFNVEPQTPKFDIDIKDYVKIDGKTMPMKWSIDFSWLDPLAFVGRWFLIIVFDIAMILGIRKIMPE